MINQYTVVGQPIAHSLSPEVHQLFAEQNDKSISYTRTESTPEAFNQTVQKMQIDGYRGCNVTAPFKEQAFAWCDKHSDHAKLAESVNTIEFLSDGSTRGSNTDGPGLVFDIENNLLRPLSGRRILILGAGGATRGVIAPLLGVKPDYLCIANRTESKAISLAEKFDHLGSINGCGFNALESESPFDIIVNATTLSLVGEMPVIPENVITHQTLAYDMTYAREDTLFMQWAKNLGASTRNGLGMLVEQAAESFQIWEGVRPDTESLYPKLLSIIEERNKRTGS